MPGPVSIDLDREARADRPGAEGDRVARRGVGDRVLDHVVERLGEGVAVGQEGAGCIDVDRPGALSDDRPAVGDGVEEVLDVERSRCSAALSSSSRPTSNRSATIDSMRFNSSTITCFVSARSPDVAEAERTEDVDVAAGDRDRRHQVVRDVGEEGALALDHPLPLVGQGGDDGRRPLAAADVPDGCDDHHRHQRHLDQLG